MQRRRGLAMASRLSTHPASGFDEHYRIVKQIGVGGMGTVYEAIDTWRNTTVALKFATGDRFQKRRARQLEQEATAMLLAANRRVCAVYRLDEYLSRPCIVMHRLVGQTLHARLAAGWTEALELR